MSSTLVAQPRTSWRRRIKAGLTIFGLLLAVAGVALAIWVRQRYAIAAEMLVPVREFSTAEYPEDPADRSSRFQQYHGRRLRLIQRDATHFDFVFEPLEKHIAQVVFRNVDVSLMTPALPEWTKSDPDLARIALIDRQWNRQQVRFDVKSPLVEVTGGDGFEQQHLYSAELAKNCLNAGLWEVQLFTQENNNKTLYYQSWFTFPLGHYGQLFEHNTGLSYRNHWRSLEHWVDPVGTPVRLEKLRDVTREREVSFRCDRTEPVLAAGEQRRKLRTVNARGLRDWNCIFDGRPIEFASFIPPGRYEHDTPHGNEYWRMAHVEKLILRDIVSPAGDAPLHELELIFRDNRQGQRCRFLVGGVDFRTLPQLPVEKYPDGMYMPMGIGVPPFFQKYEQLQQQPPPTSPFVSVLLDEKSRWLNHHAIGIDGPVLHRDAVDPNLVHLYLLSYERHMLLGHFVIDTGESEQTPPAAAGGG